MLKLKLHWQILIALGLAVLAGVLTGKPDSLFGLSIFGVSFVSIYEFIGTAFLNALKMIIVPLIASSIVVGMSNLGGHDSLGRLGGKTLLYYMSTSLFAILIGLVAVNILQPGYVEGQSAKQEMGLNAKPEELEALKKKVEGKSTGDIAEVFLRMIPTNVVATSSDNAQMLGLIFFSLLFGFFMTRIKGAPADTLNNFANGVFEVMMKITDLVMKFAPIGVFGLVAKVVAVTGLQAFQPLLYFFFTVLLALAAHLFVALPLLLKFVGRINPWAHLQAMSPALLTAFSTASSSATLPMTMECVEDNAGVSKKTSSFVLPLGATINMDGTALYECVAAMFIAQAYGIELGLATQFTIVLIALLTSIGVAGIPSASLVAISIILATVGLPADAIGMILAVDRVLDMCRTAVNIYSDSCGAAIIASTENEKLKVAYAN